MSLSPISSLSAILDDFEAHPGMQRPLVISKIREMIEKAPSNPLIEKDLWDAYHTKRLLPAVSVTDIENYFNARYPLGKRE